MSDDDNVDNSFAERRLNKLEEDNLRMTGLHQKYDHLINLDENNTAESDREDAKRGHPGAKFRTIELNKGAEDGGVHRPTWLASAMDIQPEGIVNIAEGHLKKYGKGK